MRRLWSVLALASAVLAAGACDRNGDDVEGHLDGIPTLVAEPGLRLGSTEDPADVGWGVPEAGPGLDWRRGPQ